MSTTKKDIIEKISGEFFKATFFGDSKQFKCRHNNKTVGSFYKNATEDERKAMQEITSKELWGRAAHDTMLHETLNQIKKKHSHNG